MGRRRRSARSRPAGVQKVPEKKSGRPSWSAPNLRCRKNLHRWHHRCRGLLATGLTTALLAASLFAGPLLAATLLTAAALLAGPLLAPGLLPSSLLATAAPLPCWHRSLPPFSIRGSSLLASSSRSCGATSRAHDAHCSPAEEQPMEDRERQHEGNASSQVRRIGAAKKWRQQKIDGWHVFSSSPGPRMSLTCVSTCVSASCSNVSKRAAGRTLALLKSRSVPCSAYTLREHGPECRSAARSVSFAPPRRTASSAQW